MAVVRLAVTTSLTDGVRLSDEVELYQRTYTTLLRSSGETHLRVLEPSHRAMGSSLHPLAASEEDKRIIRELSEHIDKKMEACRSMGA